MSQICIIITIILYLAVSTTDFIQSITMSIALITVVFFGIVSAGGFDTVIENAQALPGYLSMFRTHIAESGESAPYSALSIASMMAWGLGYFGM